MSDSPDKRVRCSALTKAGKQCKNLARPGAETCHVHQQQAPESVGQEQEKLQALVQELEALVADLRSSVPKPGETRAVPLSAGSLTQFIKENLDKVTPDVAKGIASTFQGATLEDLLDPETWKGMGYMMNYSLRFQLEQLKQRVLGSDSEA